MISHVNALS